MRIGIERAMPRVCAFAVCLSAVVVAPRALRADGPLDALEQACAAGDAAAVHRRAGELAAAWGESPDFAAIIGAVSSRNKDPWFRWVMIDSLVRYKRSVRTKEEAASLLDLLDSVSWAADDDPHVRAKALTVEAGLIALFREEDFIREPRRRAFGKRLAALVGDEKNGELLAAACIAAGNSDSAEAAPALRRRLRDEKLPAGVRRTAAGSLGRLRDRESIPLLADVLAKTNDRELYGSSAFALGTMGGEEVVEPLAAHAGRFNTHSCANALRKNSDAIRRMVRDAESPHLQSAVTAAGLAGMHDCLPAIEALEKDARPAVRRAAEEARRSLSRGPGATPPGGGERGEVTP